MHAGVACGTTESSSRWVMKQLTARWRRLCQGRVGCLPPPPTMLPACTASPLLCRRAPSHGQAPAPPRQACSAVRSALSSPPACCSLMRPPHRGRTAAWSPGHPTAGPMQPPRYSLAGQSMAPASQAAAERLTGIPRRLLRPPFSVQGPPCNLLLLPTRSLSRTASLACHPCCGTQLTWTYRRTLTSWSTSTGACPSWRRGTQQAHAAALHPHHRQLSLTRSSCSAPACTHRWALGSCRSAG